MQKIVPFLWFDNQAEEAVNLYTAAFKNSKITSLTRLEGAPGPQSQVTTIDFKLAGQDFIALNGGPEFAFTPAISFFVACETASEIDSIWAALMEGGQALMEIGPYPFSDRFGWVMDRFGVNWQLSLTGSPQRISPYLLFTGEQHGKAEEAMRLYTSLFDNSEIVHIERWGAKEEEPEGTIKHARFTLHGQEFMIMDSAYPHGFTFTNATSFFVNCETQAEVDRLWERLLKGGEPEQCGWLKDRFGVSWQIVPTKMLELLSDPDPERARAVMQAMLQMVKLDLGELEKAYEKI